MSNLYEDGPPDNIDPEFLAGMVRLTKALGADALHLRIGGELVAAGELDLKVARLKQYELQILSGLAAGLTTGQIGHELFVAPQTVEFYISKILQKLEVSSRAEAIAMVYPPRSEYETFSIIR